MEYVGTWELLYNPNFNSIEFDGFKNKAGTHSFVMTPKRWINSTNTIAKKQYLTLQDSNSIKKIENLDEKGNPRLLIK